MSLWESGRSCQLSLYEKKARIVFWREQALKIPCRLVMTSNHSGTKMNMHTKGNDNSASTSFKPRERLSSCRVSRPTTWETNMVWWAEYWTWIGSPSFWLTKSNSDQLMFFQAITICHTVLMWGKIPTFLEFLKCNVVFISCSSIGILRYRQKWPHLQETYNIKQTREVGPNADKNKYFYRIRQIQQYHSYDH